MFSEEGLIYTYFVDFIIDFLSDIRPVEDNDEPDHDKGSGDNVDKNNLASHAWVLFDGNVDIECNQEADEAGDTQHSVEDSPCTVVTPIITNMGHIIIRT